MAGKQEEKELEALVSLLDEPDQTIFNQVCERIASFGKAALPALENAWESNASPEIQKRIENLTHKIQYKVVKEKLAEWVSIGGKNLLYACCLT